MLKNKLKLVNFWLLTYLNGKLLPEFASQAWVELDTNGDTSLSWDITIAWLHI